MPCWVLPTLGTRSTLPPGPQTQWHPPVILTTSKGASYTSEGPRGALLLPWRSMALSPVWSWEGQRPGDGTCAAGRSPTMRGLGCGGETGTGCFRGNTLRECGGWREGLCGLCVARHRPAADGSSSSSLWPQRPLSTRQGHRVRSLCVRPNLLLPPWPDPSNYRCLSPWH